MTRLAGAAHASGAVRPDITLEHLHRMVMGIGHGYGQPGWEPSARRLIGVLMEGLRVG